MSVTTNQPRGMNLPRPRPPIVPVTHENVRDWWALFVNRKAYTRRSANPHPETSRHYHYHYQPKNKDSGQPLELDPPTVGRHLAGWITVGLYAVNPQSQCCKWIVIDADYYDAFFDLEKLKGELERDGVAAALEMSRRGGHLWIFCEPPLLAEQCRVYIYNVALRLGMPIKGTAGLRRNRDLLSPGPTCSRGIRQCPAWSTWSTPCQPPPLLVLRRWQRYQLPTELPEKLEEAH